jgi:CheY-like chemotaxis protein
MPVTDGFEFVEQFTRLGQTALIRQSLVVITSWENGRDYLKARQWQVKDYPVKPVTIGKMTLFLERHYSTSGNGH